MDLANINMGNLPFNNNNLLKFRNLLMSKCHLKWLLTVDKTSHSNLLKFNSKCLILCNNTLMNQFLTTKKTVSFQIIYNKEKNYS